MKKKAELKIGDWVKVTKGNVKNNIPVNTTGAIMFINTSTDIYTILTSTFRYCYVKKSSIIKTTKPRNILIVPINKEEGYDGYILMANKNNITVGCQNIDPEVVTKLYNFINKKR